MSLSCSSSVFFSVATVKRPFTVLLCFIEVNKRQFAISAFSKPALLGAEEVRKQVFRYSLVQFACKLSRKGRQRRGNTFSALYTLA